MSSLFMPVRVPSDAISTLRSFLDRQGIAFCLRGGTVPLSWPSLPGRRRPRAAVCQKALPPRSVDVSAVYLLSFTLLMTANNKALKGKWLKSLRLECARGLPLPLFTELPRRGVPGNWASSIQNSQKPGGFSGTTRVDKGLPKRPNIFLNCLERLVQVVPLNEHTYIVTFRVGLYALLQTLQPIPHQLCLA